MRIPELIDSIRCLLDERPSSVSAEILAHEYAKQSLELNERLSKISLMLESGGEIQALQLAQQPPQAVDLALALSFGGESAWQEFCRNHGHEVAPLVDARTLEALLTIQNKGLAPNHSLYKDYRTAISKHEDERALDLIRVIARMNPGDESAGKELKRLQRKALQASLAKLKASLDAGDELLLAAMEKVEESGLPEDYEATSEWQQGSRTRARIRRAEAWRRMPKALAQAEAELKNGEWRQAAVLHGEYLNWASNYGYQEGTFEALEERSRVVLAELQKHRSEAERAAKVRRLIVEMENIAEEVETRTLTPQGLTIDFSAPLIEELMRKRRQLEGMRGELLENSRLRIEAARDRLEQAIERANRAKRGRLVGSLAVAMFILLAGAIFGAFALRASAQADHLASLRSKRSSGGLRELVDQIKKDEIVLLKFPRLAAEVAEAEQWLEAASSKRKIVAKELAALEEKRIGEFVDMESSELFSKLRETGTLIEGLPKDMVKDESSRITILRNDGERVLVRRKEENDRRARELVAQWSAILEKMDPAVTATQAGETIESASEELGPFIKLASFEDPLLQLPASTASMIVDLDARISKIRRQIKEISASLADIENAVSPDQYRIALKKLTQGSFGESVIAQRVLDAFPDDDRLKALLVFRGDLVAMKTATDDDGDILTVPLPEAALAKDREIISELTSSEALNKLWEVEWKNSNGKIQKCLSLGELTKSGNNSRFGKLASYPKLSSTPLNFKESSIHSYEGNTLVANRPTATAAMMARLDLGKLLDSSGTRFRSSVLPLLERVANDQLAHPLAKAYVYEQLLKLVRNHKEEWGLHYCPSLLDEMNEFEALFIKAPVSEQAWLVLGKENSYADWEKYFSSRGNRGSFTQLRKTRAAAAEVLRNPIELAGRVSADGVALFGPSSHNRLVLSVCDRNDGVSEMRVCGIVDNKGKWLAASPTIVPLSPLLSIKLTNDSQEFLLSIHQGNLDNQANSTKP